jgi:hypothetical protein
MAKKRDIRQLEAVAREFGMDPVDRREFGDYLEICKRIGDLGSGPNGHFTYEELQTKAAEFRGEK